MSNEELRELVARAVNAAAPTPVFLNPLVVDEELRVTSANFGGSHGYNVSSGTKPCPYTVRWDANLARFVIYLQSNDYLFYYAGDPVTVETKEISEWLSNDWGILSDSVHDDGGVWLQVYTSTTLTGKDHVRVALESSTATPRGNEQVVASILVARLYHNCHGPVMEQKVTSAVCLGGVPGNTFDKGWYSTYKSADGWHFENRYYRIGDQGFFGSDGVVANSAGCWCLTVTKGKLYENKIECFKDIAEAFTALPGKYIIPLFVFEEDDDYDPDTAPSNIHPVLDCRLGPYIGGIGSEDHGCFAISDEGLENRYFWNGSQLVEMPEIKLTDEMANKILAISIQNGQADYEFYTGIGRLNASAAAQDTVIIPLYKFGPRLRVEVDFREMPRGDSWAVKA